MPWYVKATLCALVPLLSSCQTEAPVSLPTTTAIEKTVYIDATCATSKAILISHGDVLTLGTAEQIGDHNNEVWCRCPQTRPVGFDPKVCKV